MNWTKSSTNSRWHATLSNVGDPHVEHILLRFCLDACRVMHFLRAIDAPALQHVLTKAARVVRRTWDDVLGQPAVSDDQWTQCTLPLRLAGLGIKCFKRQHAWRASSLRSSVRPNYNFLK